MARMSKEVREARAILVASQRLEQRLAVIGWEEDVLYPALEKVKAGELKVSLEGVTVPPAALEQGAGDEG